MAVNRLRQALAVENPALDYALAALTGVLAWHVVHADLDLLWHSLRLILSL